MNRDSFLPNSPFYLRVTQSRTDGLLDLSSEEPEVFSTLQEAMAHAQHDVREHGMTVFVYECRPVGTILATKPQPSRGARPLDQPDGGRSTMRMGSKKHRIYTSLKALFGKNGPMHIDDLVDPVDQLGLFEDVKDKKMNLANFLSQLGAAGLITTDYKGNWSLPHQRRQSPPQKGSSKS